MIKKFLGKVKKVLDYVPILWNEEDDGCDDFIKLMLFKAKRMEKCITNSPNASFDRDLIISSLNNFIQAFEDYLKPSTFHKMPETIVNKLSANDLRELNRQEEEEMDDKWYKAVSILLIDGQSWYN